jgi:hypothetical protein
MGLQPTVWFGSRTNVRQMRLSEFVDGFVGIQREVAIADHPVDAEVGLDGRPEIDLSVDDGATPTGPRARATDATLAENPHVPRAVEKTLSDDDWPPVGVWQIREGVRHALDGDPATAETCHGAVATLTDRLPVGLPALWRNSDLVAGVQSQLTDF